MIPRKRLGALLALSVALGTATADEPTAASLSRRELLGLAFPAWQPALDATGKPAATMIDAIDLPAVRWPWLVKGQDRRGDIDDPATTVEVVPMNVTRLDDTHAVLTTWALPAGDEREAACDSYSCTYALGTYFFVRDGERWRLSKRVDAAAAAYGSDRPKVRAAAWPGQGFVLGATLKDCHGGACVERVSLLGLAPDQLLFAFDTAISKDDSAANEADCGSIEKPHYVLADDVPDVHCNEAQGTWRVEGDAIRIDFDETSRRVEDGKLGPLIRTRYFALLKPRDGKLVLAKGKLGNYGL